MGKIFKVILSAIVLLALLLVLAVPMLPLEKWLEDKLYAEMESRGITDVNVTVYNVGLFGATFTHISWGRKPLFTLSGVAVEYTPWGLLDKQVDVVYANNLSFVQGNLKLQIPSIAFDFSYFDIEGAQGQWRLDDVMLKGLPTEVPMLTGSGEFMWKDDIFSMRGVVQSADMSHQLAFDSSMPVHAMQDATIQLLSMQIPWNRGTISVKPTTIALMGKQPIHTTIHAKNISIETLVHAATQNRGRASGTISGQLPVTIHRDGVIALHHGQLKANQDGVLELPPDVIPGSHPQVDLVRDVLKNFHYKDFSLTAEQQDKNTISMLLAVKGNNPDLYDGRQVNLNVRLTGDLLSLIQQGMITIVDPKQLLDRNTHEMLERNNPESDTGNGVHSNSAGAGSRQAD